MEGWHLNVKVESLVPMKYLAWRQTAWQKKGIFTSMRNLIPVYHTHSACHKFTGMDWWSILYLVYNSHPSIAKLFQLCFRRDKSDHFEIFQTPFKVLPFLRISICGNKDNSQSSAGHSLRHLVSRPCYAGRPGAPASGIVTPPQMDTCKVASLCCPFFYPLFPPIIWNLQTKKSRNWFR